MFKKRDKSGDTIHFCRFYADDEGTYMFEWFCLPLKSDFTDCLKELGRLPVATMRNYVQEIKKVNELTQTIN